MSDGSGWARCGALEESGYKTVRGSGNFDIGGSGNGLGVTYFDRKYAVGQGRRVLVRQRLRLSRVG